MPLLPSVTMSVALLGKAVRPRLSSPMGDGSCHCDCGGRRNGGLGHEIAAIYGWSHDVVLLGTKVPINSLMDFGAR